MLDKIKASLGENYIENTDNVIEDIIEDMTVVALHASQRKNTEKNKELLSPYIKKAVKSEYLARGSEGLTSRSEGSISSAYEDIVKKLRTDIIDDGLRLVI